MKDFINNPFEEEYESENEIDDFQLTDGDLVFGTINPINIQPSIVSEEEDDFEDVFEVLGYENDDDDDDDDMNDPNFDIADIDESSEFSSNSAENNGEDDNVLNTSFYYGTDEDEDDDYVTFPTHSPGKDTNSTCSEWESEHSEDI